MTRKMLMILAVCALCFGGYGCGQQTGTAPEIQESGAMKMSPQDKKEKRLSRGRGTSDSAEAPAEGTEAPAEDTSEPTQ